MHTSRAMCDSVAAGHGRILKTSAAHAVKEACTTHITGRLHAITFWCSYHTVAPQCRVGNAVHDVCQQATKQSNQAGKIDARPLPKSLHWLPHIHVYVQSGTVSCRLSFVCSVQSIGKTSGCHEHTTPLGNRDMAPAAFPACYR
jgi:hypothetical protein